MKHTKRVAIIDLGTNSIRLIIGDVDNENIKKIYSERVVTKLGKNLANIKRLNNQSFEKSIETLKKFKLTAEKYNTDHLIAIGTAAIRDAEDGTLFCQKIKKETDIKVKIISGDEEAFYTLEGIKSGISNLTFPLFAVDIGGGSTDWIFTDKNNTFKGSIKIGSIRSFDQFFTSPTPNNVEIYNFKNYLQKIINMSIPIFKINTFIATGGTAFSLAMIEFKRNLYSPHMINGKTISKEKLKLLIEKIIAMSLKERKDILGISEDRVDILLPGLMILDSIVDFINIQSIVISDYGFIEGIMKNYRKFCYNDEL